MGNRTTLPYVTFELRMRDQGPKELRCVPVQTAISDLEMPQILLQWAGQNLYFSGYRNKNVKFHSWTIKKRCRMRGSILDCETKDQKT